MSSRVRMTLLAVLVSLAIRPAHADEPAPIAIVGGTVVDVSHFGRSSIDRPNSVVLIRNGKITAVGDADAIAVPQAATRMNAAGKYIVPGYIDGFAVLNNQSYANAYLYMGVTSIVGVGDMNWRRGPMFYDADPSPHIYRFEHIGYDPKPAEQGADAESRSERPSTREYIAELERMQRDGIRVVMLHYHLEPDQLKALAARCRELGMATIGELGYTSYAEAIEFGVDSFVHTSRYSLDLAAPDVRRAVGDAPFDRDRPGLRAYRELLETIKPDDPRLLGHARRLGSGRVGLIGTLAMDYPDLPGARNPWTLPVAAILNPADIHEPLDRKTGARPATFRSVSPHYAAQLLMMDQAYHNSGAKYLAGSGTDAFSTMPGISLHQEVELLGRVGLTPREALAAATWNYAAIYRWSDIGEIKPGARADVLVLSADPRASTENLQKIDALILAGKPIDRDKLLNR